MRILSIFLLAIVIGWTLRRISLVMDRSGQPAGFGQGIIQGALMPMALPNFLIGNDVTIYAQNNTGVPYKLGYTAGVNGAGLLFFGCAFWRLSRWSKKNPEDQA